MRQYELLQLVDLKDAFSDVGGVSPPEVLFKETLKREDILATREREHTAFGRQAALAADDVAAFVVPKRLGFLVLDFDGGSAHRHRRKRGAGRGQQGVRFVEIARAHREPCTHPQPRRRGRRLGNKAPGVVHTALFVERGRELLGPGAIIVLHEDVEGGVGVDRSFIGARRRIGREKTTNRRVRHQLKPGAATVDDLPREVQQRDAAVDAVARLPRIQEQGEGIISGDRRESVKDDARDTVNDDVAADAQVAPCFGAEAGDGEAELVDEAGGGEAADLCEARGLTEASEHERRPGAAVSTCFFRQRQQRPEGAGSAVAVAGVEAASAVVARAD